MKTPQLSFPKLAAALKINNEIWLKREDLHHYGSHKGRSIPTMISDYRKQGVFSFVISSSGNAALAAVLAVQKFNQSVKGEPLKLTVLVGKKIDNIKLIHLHKILNVEPLSTDPEIPTLNPITIGQCERPKQRAFQMEKDGGAKWLRQSADDLALVGYQELAGELAKISNLSAVFVPTSSGTTAQGLYEGFQQMGLNPEIHIVQTKACHPMVGTSTTTQGRQGGESIATAIVDIVALRKPKILEILKNSHGAGWIATNDEIAEAIKLVKEKTDLEISPNSALSIVGLTQAIKNNKSWTGAVVCLITGR